jgi:hypothetical protein
MERSGIQNANRMPQAQPSPPAGASHRLRAAVWTAVVLAVSASGATAATVAAPGVEPPAAVVDGVVMPAWLERSGMRQPVVPGMVLQERDRIVTGANARILLTLPEGSRVKLGESAQLDLDSLIARQEGGSVFLKSALNVVIGAFRFTTSALNKVNSRRDVSIRLATVTAGIRGTDLWGKQGGDKEIVCLLEGKIEVSRDVVAGQTVAPVILDQPLQFYIAPKDAPTLPVGRVDEAQLALWAAETEIAPDAGGATVDGQWTMRFDGDTTFAGALSAHEFLRNRGYAAQFVPDKKNGKRIYRVQLSNLSAEGDARALAQRLSNYGLGVPSLERTR